MNLNIIFVDDEPDARRRVEEAIVEHNRSAPAIHLDAKTVSTPEELRACLPAAPPVTAGLVWQRLANFGSRKGKTGRRKGRRSVAGLERLLVLRWPLSRRCGLRPKTPLELSLLFRVAPEVRRIG